MAMDYMYTLVENDTDTEFTIRYQDDTYSLRSKGSSVVVRFESFALRDTLLPSLWFTTGSVQLKPIFHIEDLFDNVYIAIVGDVANSYSCLKTPRTAQSYLQMQVLGSADYALHKAEELPPRNSIRHDSIWEQVKFHLHRMEDLHSEVRIWHNQCHYLLKKFREGVEQMEGKEQPDLVLRTLAHMDLEAYYNACCQWTQWNPLRAFGLRPSSLLYEFTLCTLLRSMAEGEALLRSCGELSYNRAALALCSPPPSKPTFSKFALATRELDWIVDFICCDPEDRSRLDNWEWCEQRCRLVPSNGTNRLDALEDDSLEADVRRQKADREALQASLVLKFSRSHGNSSFKFLSPLTSWVRGTSNQGELEAVWRKRLQPSSCAPGSYSPLDAFVVENPDTSFVEHSVGSSRNGASKNVVKCKWLGETVALSAMSNVSKLCAKAETGFLARLQHPNVVEWLGYAFKEDIWNPNYYRDCYLVTEHMDCDLDDLITERLTNADGTISTTRPPFDFLVAVDIALQIVEAMIHVHKCRVLHRDIKPKNILASPKYFQPPGIMLPIFYTVKLIDFGSSKMGDEGSHFHTRKQGTTMYMAPEVWESEDSYTWSADVYSFGLTCYEIFTGRLPWESDMPLTFANVQKVMRGKIRFPFAFPEELEELIRKCCAHEPSDRPSFEVIRQALWWLKFHPLREAISFCFWYWNELSD